MEHAAQSSHPPVANPVVREMQDLEELVPGELGGEIVEAVIADGVRGDVDLYQATAWVRVRVRLGLG